jgi:S-adenosylmethionine:tRNA ribosyltransferase-isomerase
MADFDYELPDRAIAQTPIEPRDAARLLVDRGSGEPEHRSVRELPDLLVPGDLVVVNDTRVLPARLRLRRSTGGAVEVLLLEQLDDTGHRWEALVRPSRKVRVGERVEAGSLTVEVGAARADDTREVRLLTDADPLVALAAHGEVPLPPYITQSLGDPERYQTVYARRPASAAAPTAGLHVTPAVLDALAARGIGLARVELVVGLDTFKPVQVDDPADHHMHSEAYVVPQETVEACRATRAAGGRVVAIGTTATRALESAAARGEPTGRTDLFIRRPYDWQVVDLMLTNFHLPRTTLLLMIDAFVGPRWRRLYETALAERYRFLSFGDAMLLERGAR